PHHQTLLINLIFSCFPHLPHFPFSLHDALPISCRQLARAEVRPQAVAWCLTELAKIQHAREGEAPAAALYGRAHTTQPRAPPPRDRKSTRLNSSHVATSYAVFCLKKKKKPTSLK